MGFSEFQQHGLSRDLSSRFLSESVTEDSESEEDDRESVVFDAKEKWIEFTRKVVYYQKFIQVVQDSAKERKRNKLRRRRLRAIIDRILLSPIEIFYIHSVLQYTGKIPALPYGLYQKTQLVCRLIPCSIGKGIMDVNSSRRIEKGGYWKSLGWLVLKATWQQPFNNIIVKTLCHSPISLSSETLFKGSLLSISRELLENGMYRLSRSALWTSGREDAESGCCWPKMLFRVVFGFCLQYFIPAGLCIVNLNMQKSRDSTFTSTVSTIYTNHGIVGFFASFKINTITIASSLIVYNIVHYMVDSIMPSKERYEEEVSKVKADLLRSTGKVVKVKSATELTDLIRSQAIVCILIYSNGQNSNYASKRMKDFNRNLAKEYINRIVFAQINVDVVKGLELYVESENLATWLVIIHGKPVAASSDLGEIKLIMNKLIAEELT